MDWQLVDDELHAHFNRVLEKMGGFLNGRVMYELMARAWPMADQDPASTRPMREFARIWREMPKVVYSRTLASADWNATVIHEVVPADVQALNAAPAGDLVIGGADLVATFLAHDLLDFLFIGATGTTLLDCAVVPRGRPWTVRTRLSPFAACSCAIAVGRD